MAESVSRLRGNAIPRFFRLEGGGGHDGYPKSRSPGVAPSRSPAEAAQSRRWLRASLLPHDRPARLLVRLVVLVFPPRTACVAPVAGDVDGAAAAVAIAALDLAAGHLHEFGVPRCAAPVPLDARARGAQRHPLQ